MSDVDTTKTDGRDGRDRRRPGGLQPYEPPAIEWLGSWEMLTGSLPPAGALDVLMTGDTSVCDRTRKERVETVRCEEVLDAVSSLPVLRWSYAGERARHIGPMAQDFAAAFGLGEDDRHIHTIDAAGVALSAIQALHARLLRAEGELLALRAASARNVEASV